jgi:hypothetical protein
MSAALKNWCKMYRRGFDAAVMMALVGPVVGGAVFGLMAYVTHIILAVRGQLPRPAESIFNEALLFGVLTLAFALIAPLLPHVWYMAALAALYVVPRVGTTGRMTWIETVVLAVTCVAAVGYVYPEKFLDVIRHFLLPTICGAIAVRYLAGRLGYVH